MFLTRVWSSASAEEGLVDVTSPLLYVGAVLGAVVVLVFIWVTLRRITHSARELVNELRVQLGADERGAQADSPLRPASELGEGQLACVEIVSRVALRGMLAPAIVGVGFPLLIGVVLRILASGDRVQTSAEALVALLVVATIAGAFGSLLFTNAGSAWDNAKKYIETGAHGGRYLVDGDVDNPTYVAAVIGDTVGDPLKGAIGPATPALVITLAAFALVFLPFFL